MPSSLSFALFFSLLSLLFSFISSSNSTTSTIPLSLFNTKHPSQDLYEKLTHLASISLARANYIKKSQDSPVSTTPLYPQSYGGYSITLSFGTPPQKIPFIMDTGSSFVWFPCTTRYLCTNCSVSSATSQSIPTFIPKSSSSARVVGCLNPKCGWIHSNNPKSRCQDCESPTNCKQVCPPYIILYGSGSTGGLALVDTLDLSNKKVPNFLVGCSLFSSKQPAGIAGLGRGLASLPNQLGVKKFSYCLVSHKFDDTGKSSNLVLDFNASGEKTAGLSYTPLLKNPVVSEKNALSVYYYVSLRKITVGGKKVKIPYKYLTPDSNGNGGSIVDSGTTFTFMNRGVFEPVLDAFVKQVKGIPRSESIEIITGLKPCFNISRQETVSLPELKFHFKGGAEMTLPIANYFSFAGEIDVICLTMVTDSAFGPELSTGPSIILGNFQMQNYLVEFDLKNEKFGFKQQMCK
ncbi:probable aspartyl protease At4g16563 [Solanum lycopersicum]|uniref:Peptidase A1 domain-containing protein n=1 Tax=Solanum lycopersicum TaxID=4081 RepID=A0A3Q7HVV9_SOLLC|nr:probable aspartyl protease At4g16563 [Solanum lycopersicum]